MIHTGVKGRDDEMRLNKNVFFQFIRRRPKPFLQKTDELQFLFRQLTVKTRQRFFQLILDKEFSRMWIKQLQERGRGRGSEGEKKEE